MRAGRLFALLFALGLAGFVPAGPDGLLPLAIRFVSPASAEPQVPAKSAPSAETGSTLGPTGSSDAESEHTLPHFVPSDQTLKLSDESSSEGEAASGEPDGTDINAQRTPAPSDPPKTRTVKITTEPILGTGLAVTASLKTETNAPKWPEFVGAKKLFGAVKKPAPLEARAIGYYSRGCLSGAVALPIDGPAWQEMRLSRNRNWGHPELIALVKRFATDAQKLDGWPGLLVGDIAQPRGGPMSSGHASHQVGLDADIWLTPMPNRRLTRKEREEIEATSMLDKTGVAVDPKVFTDKQVALIKRAASYPEVERIFVHPAIKKALCQASGTDRHWLGKVRPYYGHYYHFHVRIKCPAGFVGCKTQAPPTGDDGCGKEVDQWLAKVIPAKPSPLPPVAKAPGVSVRPPKPPVMLADLPAECRALLAAKPDPVPVPREALMTRPAVREALKRAAAARAAFAKAEGIATIPPSAATAAAHPALRPHVKKTNTAEKK